MNRLEDALQATVVQGLRYALPPGWKVAAIPNGGYRTRAEARLLKRTGVYAGIPDIVIIGEADWGAAVWWLELKSPTGKLTPKQRRCHEELRELGHSVAVVRSWEDVLTALKQWRVPLRLAGLANA